MIHHHVTVKDENSLDISMKSSVGNTIYYETTLHFKLSSDFKVCFEESKLIIKRVGGLVCLPLQRVESDFNEICKELLEVTEYIEYLDGFLSLYKIATFKATKSGLYCLDINNLVFRDTSKTF